VAAEAEAVDEIHAADSEGREWLARAAGLVDGGPPGSLGTAAGGGIEVLISAGALSGQRAGDARAGRAS
jgi:hypothetical protein